MAIDLYTTVTGRPGGDEVRLRSTELPGEAAVDLSGKAAPFPQPQWARYVRGTVSEVQPKVGFTGRVATTVPLGAGLSSSAALVTALALALGFAGSATELAQTCQRAERTSSGVPCGIMDQLACARGVEGHALFIDCETLAVEPVPVPEQVDVVVIDSGERRWLAHSAYAECRANCETAAALIGPLRQAELADVAGLSDPQVRSRARHVVTENLRVRAYVAALREGDVVECGRLMLASHRSLRNDFGVSTPRLDRLVAELMDVRSVYGARLTGAGFGGSVVALTQPGALSRGWHVAAVGGAHVEIRD